MHYSFSKQTSQVHSHDNCSTATEEYHGSDPWHTKAYKATLDHTNLVQFSCSKKLAYTAPFEGPQRSLRGSKSTQCVVELESYQSEVVYPGEPRRALGSFWDHGSYEPCSVQLLNLGLVAGGYDSRILDGGWRIKANERHQHNLGLAPKQYGGLILGTANQGQNTSP